MKAFGIIHKAIQPLFCGVLVWSLGKPGELVHCYSGQSSLRVLPHGGQKPPSLHLPQSDCSLWAVPGKSSSLSHMTDCQKSSRFSVNISWQ